QTRGLRLSAGERQLVSIARIALADPAVIVLDEATSSLDPATEAAVERALAAVAEGRTVVTIAHRLSTAERADRVAVMEHGRRVLGRIWLPGRTLQLGPAAPGWDRFAKIGTVVRAGPPVVLEVPPRWRGVYSLEYAPKHVQRLTGGSTRLSVHACAGALGNWS